MTRGRVSPERRSGPLSDIPVLVRFRLIRSVYRNQKNKTWKLKNIVLVPNRRQFRWTGEIRAPLSSSKSKNPARRAPVAIAAGRSLVGESVRREPDVQRQHAELRQIISVSSSFCVPLPSAARNDRVAGSRLQHSGKGIHPLETLIFLPAAMASTSSLQPQAGV